jgi:hypothetical protein
MSKIVVEFYTSLRRFIKSQYTFMSSAHTGESKTNKTTLGRKESSSLLSQKNKQKEEPDLEVTVLLTDSPLEIRKREASKPLYLTRYE